MKKCILLNFVLVSFTAHGMDKIIEKIDRPIMWASVPVVVGIGLGHTAFMQNGVYDYYVKEVELYPDRAGSLKESGYFSLAMGVLFGCMAAYSRESGNSLELISFLNLSCVTTSLGVASFKLDSWFRSKSFNKMAVSFTYLQTKNPCLLSLFYHS